jgi:mannose-6-phosphate isomerase-like protein (cupin superfamily)
MAYSGQTISNPVTAEQITFLETTRDTEGARLLFDCRVGLTGGVLPAHIHAAQAEHLEVIEGTLGVLLGDSTYVLREGQSIAMPAKFKHQWWNADDDELLLRVEVVPPRRLEAVLEAVSGMAHEGRLRGNGMPRNVFDLANLVRLSETYAPALPVWVQWIGLRLASWLSPLLGHDPSFARYRTQTPEMVPAGTDHR